jgi:DNA repair photolyase
LDQGYEWGKVSNYRTKENLIECVEKDLKKIKPEDKRTVFFCTTCDPCATEEHTSMTISAIQLIMEKSDLQVRVLSKSDRIFEIAKALDNFRDRIIYGLSTGTIRPEIAACIEENASPLKERLEMLHLLQDMRCRTFGMLCPILPSERPYLDQLLDAVRPDECEMVWAEPLNVRGKSLEKTRSRLEECGFDGDAKILKEVMGNKDKWRHYTKDLFLAVRDEFNKRGIRNKLRYLQYVIKEPNDFVEFFSSYKEALCLGKKKLK